MRVRATWLAVAIVSGCGTTADNSDVGQGINLAGQTSVADTTPVTIAATGPALGSGGTAVDSYSCKNKMWDPAPSEANATALLKRKAMELGFSSIHSVKIEPDANPIARNCWAGIKASAIAFNAPA